MEDIHLHDRTDRCVNYSGVITVQVQVWTNLSEIRQFYQG